MNKLKLIICFVVISIGLSGCGDKSTESIGTCTFSVECSTIFDHMKDLDPALKDYIPKSGIILEKRTVEIQKGDSVYDILKRELKKENILHEESFTANSVYVEGIDNIYEFSCGDLSGWMYSVNGEYPGKSCSEYKVSDKDTIEWHYTCELGEDLKK